MFHVILIRVLILKKQNCYYRYKCSEIYVMENISVLDV